MSKRGRGGASGAKFRISLGLPVGAVCFFENILLTFHFLGN